MVVSPAMPFLIWAFLEIYLFVFVLDQAGFLGCLAIYFLPSLVAWSLLPLFQSRNPVALLGVFLWVLPSGLTRFIGTFFVLPGFRHLLIYLSGGWLVRKMQQNSNLFVRFGSFDQKYKFSNDFQDQSNSQTSSIEREVSPRPLNESRDTIDVTAKRL